MHKIFRRLDRTTIRIDYQRASISVLLTYTKRTHNLFNVFAEFFIRRHTPAKT